MDFFIIINGLLAVEFFQKANLCLQESPRLRFFQRQFLSQPWLIVLQEKVLIYPEFMQNKSY